MNKLTSTLLITAGLFASNHLVLAADPLYTAPVNIVQLEGGWSVESMSVSTTGTPLNPAGCQFTSDGAGRPFFATLHTDGGRKLFHDILQESFLYNRPVQLLISGTDCAYSKPHIIAVAIKR